MVFVDQTGRKFGKLTVICRVAGSKPIKWECLCECGKISIVLGGNLTKTKNPTESCGCLRPKPPSNLSHGLSREKVYMVYYNVLQRCTNPNSEVYQYYGGRPGNPITVCEEWTGENGFITFYEQMGPPPEGMTLERIDNSKGYCKANCEWRPMHDQSRNKRNNRMLSRPSDGKTQCMADWAKELGLHRSQIGRRLDAGWSMGEALSIPNSPAQRDLITGEFVKH